MQSFVNDNPFTLTFGSHEQYNRNKGGKYGSKNPQPVTSRGPQYPESAKVAK